MKPERGFYRFPKRRINHARALAMLLSSALNDTHFVMWCPAKPRAGLWVGPQAMDWMMQMTIASEYYLKGEHVARAPETNLVEALKRHRRKEK